MSTGALFAVAGVLLFVIGLYGIFGRPDLLGKIIGTNVVASGAFAFLIGSAPQAADGPDPVPQALVLTGIVISVSITAYALSLLRRIVDETGAATLPEDDGDEGP